MSRLVEVMLDSVNESVQSMDGENRVNVTYPGAHSRLKNKGGAPAFPMIQEDSSLPSPKT